MSKITFSCILFFVFIANEYAWSGPSMVIETNKNTELCAQCHILKSFHVSTFCKSKVVSCFCHSNIYQNLTEQKKDKKKGKWTDYTAIIVALIALFSSLYLSWKNNQILKKMKWFDFWSTKVDAICGEFYELCNHVLTKKKKLSRGEIQLKALELENKLFSLIGRNEELKKYIDQLISKLISENQFENKDNIYEILFKFSGLLNSMIEDKNE